jgi:predicted RNase H-like HicB family nuclease
MESRQYLAVIHKDDDSDFSVSFPDFPGCITAGSSLEEAAKMAREALEFHIKGMQEDKEKIPEPSSLDEIKHIVGDGLTFFLVSVKIKSSVMKRINIIMPEDVIEAVDKAARSEGISRSAFLVDAARTKVEVSMLMADCTGAAPVIWQGGTKLLDFDSETDATVARHFGSETSEMNHEEILNSLFINNSAISIANARVKTKTVPKITDFGVYNYNVSTVEDENLPILLKDTDKSGDSFKKQ